MNRRVKAEPIDTFDINSEPDEEYVTVYKDDERTDIPLEDDRSIALSILQPIFRPEKIKFILIQYDGKRKLIKPKNGFFKEPKRGWNGVKINVLVNEENNLPSEDTVKSKSKNKDAKRSRKESNSSSPIPGSSRSRAAVAEDIKSEPYALPSISPVRIVDDSREKTPEVKLTTSTTTTSVQQQPELPSTNAQNEEWPANNSNLLNNKNPENTNAYFSEMQARNAFMDQNNPNLWTNISQPSVAPFPGPPPHPQYFNNSTASFPNSNFYNTSQPPQPYRIPINPLIPLPKITNNSSLEFYYDFSVPPPPIIQQPQQQQQQQATPSSSYATPPRNPSVTTSFNKLSFATPTIAADSNRLNRKRRWDSPPHQNLPPVVPTTKISNDIILPTLKSKSVVASTPNKKIKFENQRRQIQEAESEETEEEEEFEEKYIPKKSSSSSEIKKTKKQPPPQITKSHKTRIAVAEDDHDGSDCEVDEVHRPAKGEFGIDNIGIEYGPKDRTFLTYFKVQSWSQLCKLNCMRMPINLDSTATGWTSQEFINFRDFALKELRRTLMKAASSGSDGAGGGGCPMYILFVASKSDVLVSVIDKNVSHQCKKCKTPFTLQHLLSIEHISWYHKKYEKDPPQLLQILDPHNHELFMPKDDRHPILKIFKVKNFDDLQNSKPFSNNRFCDENIFKSLAGVVIDCFKYSKRDLKPNWKFSIEKMIFLKFIATDSEELQKYLKDLFSDYPRDCSICSEVPAFSSGEEYMKHLLSKNHIRKGWSQSELNKISDAMNVLKPSEDGFDIIIPRNWRPRRRISFNSSDSESNSDKISSATKSGGGGPSSSSTKFQSDDDSDEEENVSNKKNLPSPINISDEESEDETSVTDVSSENEEEKPDLHGNSKTNDSSSLVPPEKTLQELKAELKKLKKYKKPTLGQQDRIKQLKLQIEEDISNNDVSLPKTTHPQSPKKSPKNNNKKIKEEKKY